MSEQITTNNKMMGRVSDDKYYEINSWEDPKINIKNDLLKGIYSHGFEKPSPIQKKAVYAMSTFRDKDGKPCDILAQAQSGTGKSGTFIISSLQNVDTTLNETQIMVLSPTHELARQTKEVYDKIGIYLNINTALLIGGKPVETDKRALEHTTPHIISGTPGRIHDLIRRKYINPNTIKIFIIDEVDEMLSHGFRAQMYDILKVMPNEIQICLFSATLPKDMITITNEFLNNPATILVKAEQLTLEGIEQCYINVQNDAHKYDTIKKLYGQLTVNQAIIYCNSIKRVDDLYEAMNEDKFPVNKIHGQLDSEDRKKISKGFRDGTYRLLICTDMFARGIDVQQVSLVINFDIPKSAETYLHRIGRSGRWGRQGKAINFQSRFDASKLKRFEEYYQTVIHELPENWVDYLEQ